MGTYDIRSWQFSRPDIEPIMAPNILKTFFALFTCDTWSPLEPKQVLNSPNLSRTCTLWFVESVTMMSSSMPEQTEVGQSNRPGSLPGPPYLKMSMRMIIITTLIKPRQPLRSNKSLGMKSLGKTGRHLTRHLLLDHRRQLYLLIKQPSELKL